MNETAEELRIIASDAILSAHDREAVRRATDEYDMIQRQLIATQQALIDSQAMRLAQHDKIVSMKRAMTIPANFLPVIQAHWDKP